MSACSNPGKMSGCEASRQTMFRTTKCSNGRPDFGGEFREIVWSKVFSCMAGMCPNELHRIELRGTDWKRINMQTRLRLDKVLDQASLMNGMVIPDRTMGPAMRRRICLRKRITCSPRKFYSKGSCRQLHFSSTWTNQEMHRAYSVVDDGPDWCMYKASVHGVPNSFEVEKPVKIRFHPPKQPGIQFTSFFLSEAADAPSNSR
jgi:hypothetical protein